MISSGKAHFLFPRSLQRQGAAPGEILKYVFGEPLKSNGSSSSSNNNNGRKGSSGRKRNKQQSEEDGAESSSSAAFTDSEAALSQQMIRLWSNFFASG